ncbi:protein MFI isoform X1 [Sceloporus undulatus]|uniref:protein MFI isoform X1 n=1 Tax=Sceloporus undulatus TaxID=8520 RepID=UPI001C4C0743|nr:protein MFI isoform X1 [Sceloporus undulatus]XP_042316363.1 protein MFI isoform X1 [Sceloporus undulatus]XP_042316364.1 protein MFI isoform X1 [Sceloporus undulatus]XP_042316365.1 protein MFI isoform X1 [Sceloporus undulatus]
MSAIEAGFPKDMYKHGIYGQYSHEASDNRYIYPVGKENFAAIVIQRAWKRWLDIGVFDYYKELIGFKQCGEPARLMKYIDPKEAEYLDAAAGVHIRFRLGGLKFPPSIYYKIYTHRPIVDVCAYSPRDYAKLAAKTRQSRKFQGDRDKDCSDWYKRIEYNGWRLLSLRFWKTMDSVTLNDNKIRKEFQYSKLLRKQDVEKRRKRRKIEWLKQMYYGQSLQVKTQNPAATILIQRAAEGLISSLDHGMDKVLEWEVDEMLKWTNALNYENYVKEWTAIGTSKASDGYRGFQFSEQHCDLYELSQIPETVQELVKSRGEKPAITLNR